MRVVELQLFHVRVPLKRPVRHASSSRSVTDNIVVRCRLDDGTVGWGEGVPRPYVTGETAEVCVELFDRAVFGPLLADPFDDLAGAVGLVDQLDVVGQGEGPRSGFGNALRCAVELSVLDAACRAVGRPLSAVTQLVPEALPLRAARERVQYSAVLTLSSPRKQTVQLWKFRLYGFRYCKVKVGPDDEANQAALRRARRILGRSVDLRIDVNEAWDWRQLEQKLQPLCEFGLSCVEQPVPHEQVERLAELRRRLPVRVMLDESLCSLDDAHRAVERGLCDLFNIRLSKCGGFVRSLKVAAVAHRAGLGFQLGCQVGETGLLSAAGRHFATSVAELSYVEGSYDRHLVRERLTRQDVTFGYGGWAPALPGPGLGVDVDSSSLQRCLVQSRTWRPSP